MDLLQKQRALQSEAFGVNPEALEGADLVAYATFNALAVSREVGEALDHLKGWKWHSHAEPHVDDRGAYVEELGADALRHLLNLLLLAGVDWGELVDVFDAKEKTVRARQDSGSYVG